MKLFFKKDAKKVYIYSCFLSQFFFTFVFTVNLLYQVEIVKLDALQLVLVGTVLEVSVFLFEIPTGIVSDLKSRKLSIIIGYLLIGIGFIMEGLFPFFMTVIAAQIIWGIGYTFTSGSQQAWIADEIGEERASHAFIIGAKAGNLGKIIAIPLSMATGYFSFNLPIVLGGIGMIGLSILLLLFMKEEHFKPANRTERVSTWKNIKDTTSQIMAYSKGSSLLRALLLIALFFGFYSEGFDRLWISHIFDGINLTKGKFVMVVGGIQFIVVLFSFAALHFISKSLIHEKLKSIYAALFVGSILIVSSLVGFALSSYLISLLIFYIMIQVARYVMHPLEDIWLNQMIPDSSTRATFFSVKGQVDAIGQISGGPVIGLIALNFTIKTAILACAILLSPVLFLYRAILKK